MTIEKFSARSGRAEKLQELEATLEEIKNAVGILTDELEAEACPDTIDLLTDAMEALDDAIDDLEEVRTGTM